MPIALAKFHSRQLAHHVALSHLLEHLPHLRVLAKKVVNFLHRPSRSAGDALAAAAIDHVVMSALVLSHRVNDGFYMIDLFLVNLVGMFLQSGKWPDAGQHTH